MDTIQEQEVTNKDIMERLDILGNQMNWLCENLESLFGFVTQMGQSGGGLRGMLKLLSNNSMPELSVKQGDDTSA